jgi:hypothetical protein
MYIVVSMRVVVQVYKASPWNLCTISFFVHLLKFLPKK